MLNWFGVCCLVAAYVSTDFSLEYKDKFTVCTFETK
jgi:hypothetical protein